MQKTWVKSLLVFFILACAVFGVFGRTYTYDYSMLDDNLHIEGNRNLLRRNLPTLKKIWTEKYEVVYTPVTYTFWMGVAAISKSIGIKSPHSEKHKFHPGIFHLTNTTFHLLTTWMVFLCLSHLSLGLAPSFIGALLFALHPVQVETVTWLTGFRDVLAGFFGFASILFFIKGIKDQRAIRYSFFMLSAFLLSMLSKSSGLVVVAFQFIIGIFLLNKSFKEVLKYLSPLLIAAACFVPIFIFFNNGGLPARVTPLNLLERMELIIHNTGFYATKIFFPLHNVFDYGLTPEKVLKEKLYQSYLLLLLPLLLVVFLVDNQWKEKKLSAVFLLFVAGFFPVCGIVPFIYQAFSTVADRYLYFSLFSLSLFCAYLIQQKPKLNLAIISLFLAVLTFESTRLVQTWSSNELFNSYIIKYNPNSWLAYNNLGVAIETRNDYEGAYKAYHRAAELSNGATPWYNAGSMAIKLEKFELAEELYRKALTASKDAAWAKVSIATALALQGRMAQAQAEISNLHVEPVCSSNELIETKTAVENQDIEKLKSLRMEARF